MLKSHMKRCGKPAVAPTDFPATAPYVTGNYFPNSRVASNGTSFTSPLSYASRSGQVTPTPNDLASVPTGGDSPWIIHVQSDEQGVGRSPGWQWPSMVHSEAYNFSQIDIMPFEFDQTYVDGFPDSRTGKPWIGRQPPERVGWSVPRYYEEYEQWASGSSGPDSVAVLADPQSQSYTAFAQYMDDGSGAYG